VLGLPGFHPYGTPNISGVAPRDLRPGLCTAVPTGLQPAKRAKEHSPGRGVPQHARLFARGGVLVSPGLGWQKNHFHSAEEVLRCAQDFACGLPLRSRPQTGSTCGGAQIIKSFSRTASLRLVVHALPIRFCRPLKRARSHS
jgi:hypothetical protein